MRFAEFDDADQRRDPLRAPSVVDDREHALAHAPLRPPAPRHVMSLQLMSLQRSAGNSAVIALLAKKRLAEKGIEGEDEPMKDEGSGPAAEKRAVDKETHCAHDDADAYADTSLQRQPAPAPPAAAPPAAAPPSVAVISYLPKKMDLAPGGDWGVTTEDDVIVDITAYPSGGGWNCVVTTATQQAHQGVHLLAGVSECTAAKVSSAGCARLAKMKTSLNDVADQNAHSGWYMLAAVKAHEDLHITQYRASLNPAFTTFKAAVEAITVPAAPNAAAAKAAIKALPAYTTARAALQAADVAANNATAAHAPMAPFIAAEHAVVDPRITTIDARRTTLKCAP